MRTGTFTTDVIRCQLWSEHWWMWKRRSSEEEVSVSQTYLVSHHFLPFHCIDASLCCLFHSNLPLLSWCVSIGWDEKHQIKGYFLSGQCVCVFVHVLRCLWHCRHFGRLCLITVDTEGNKSCLSWSQVLHNSCGKCQQSKQSGQRDLLHCCSAVTQLSSTRYACCGKPFIFTIMCDLAADGWYRANCRSKTHREGNVYGKTWIVGSPP